MEFRCATTLSGSRHVFPVITCVGEASCCANCHPVARRSSVRIIRWSGGGGCVGGHTFTIRPNQSDARAAVASFRYSASPLVVRLFEQNWIKCDRFGINHPGDISARADAHPSTVAVCPFADVADAACGCVFVPRRFAVPAFAQADTCGDRGGKAEAGKAGREACRPAAEAPAAKPMVPPAMGGTQPKLARAICRLGRLYGVRLAARRSASRSPNLRPRKRSRQVGRAIRSICSFRRGRRKR